MKYCKLVYYPVLPKKYKYCNLDPTPEVRLNRFNQDYVEQANYNDRLGMYEYRDFYFKDIMYNHIYESAMHTPYIIINRFSYQNNPSTTSLIIQMLISHSVLKTSYMKFKKQNTFISIFDPYQCTIFNNNCCIGNIDYEPLGESDKYKDMLNGKYMYAIWQEVMGRCFDPQHPMYGLYGACGVVPAFPQWRCFKYFYLYFEIAYHANPTIKVDPNDPFLYLHFTHPMTIEAIQNPNSNNYISPYDKQKFDKLEANMKLIPPMQRPYVCKRRPGQVAQYTLDLDSLPENVIYVGEKPRLYTLIQNKPKNVEMIPGLNALLNNTISTTMN